MLYKFKCQATGEIMMTSRVGGHLLRVMGKAVDHPGILLSQEISPAIQALETAVREEQAHLGRGPGITTFRASAAPDEVTLRQSAWPLIEMMKRARTEGQAIVWGV
ncbi:DUF1840 domain-containing protein [Burkholderiaceae bacterium UC74_6]